MNAITEMPPVGLPVSALTRAQKLDIALAAINDTEKIYQTIRETEKMTLASLCEHPVAGTIFEPMVTALNIHGVATPYTVGGIMDSLELDDDHVHNIACACHENSDYMSSIHALTVLAIINENEEGPKH